MARGNFLVPLPSGRAICGWLRRAVPGRGGRNDKMATEAAAAAVPTATEPKPKLNVQSFPRPPLLEKTSRHLRITWDGQVIAETRDAYWVLETHHPPTYYLPPDSIRVPLTQTRQSTYCEWKGVATYYCITHPSSVGEIVSNRIWSYDSPTTSFGPIAGYLSFYAGPWDCYVDGEEVVPQPGTFYGGWVTSDIEGIVKGSWGNQDPAV